MTSTLERIRKKYPDKCPVLIDYGGKTLKLIVPKDCVFASLMMQVRVQLKQRGWFGGNNEKALFLFTQDGRVLSGTQLVQEIDTPDGTGAIKLTCTAENTFGAGGSVFDGYYNNIHTKEYSSHVYRPSLVDSQD